jgi:2-oxoglutarate ferredoxin oxidoreductase subunit alpha
MALIEGSAAVVEASIAAGCRFFAGYPMTPFTEVLEHFAERLPAVGGVCINAESELEAVGMAWGAAATGARAATGSTGQGLSLMQESFAEMALAGIPIVIFNMSRGQGDYYQSTRGGGHGDYRHIVLAPWDVTEAASLTQLAFHLADEWRIPVLLYGDYLIAHTSQTVDLTPAPLPPPPAKPWAVDGSLGGTTTSRIVSSLGFAKHGQSAPGITEHVQVHVDKTNAIAAAEQRWDSADTEDADVVVVAFGTCAKFAAYACRELRAEGHRVGWFRPISLWPFPTEPLAAATKNARTVAVFENNAGQMIDDVRLAVLGRSEVRAIGGISTDGSGFGVGPMMNTDVVRARILDSMHAVSDSPAAAR